MSNENTLTAPTKAIVSIGRRGIELTDLDSLWRFSLAVSKSGLAPKGIQTPEAIMIAIQMGMEVGMTPMAALQNIAVINGRPSIWGDAQLGIVRATGKLEVFEEWFEVGGKRIQYNPPTYTDDVKAVCRSKREGYAAADTSFSVADAKTAKLWGKEGPWTQYPGRMLKSRARSFNLRDGFGDALKGLLTAEELRDIIDVEEVKETKKIGASIESFAKKPKAEKAVSPIATPPADALLSAIEAMGFTPKQFSECLVIDGKIEPEQSNRILTIKDIPADVIAHYVGADGQCSEAIRSMDFVIENSKQ